ncbi:hypothetical protein GCM10010921_24160 [Microbacterium album]|uniref:Uncharacterized protein n=1 Tax=Microbacterium album TaxID=2053191 RepID=A0A917IF84_9MICO|nr:hypothetical protein GCM10010921_24160 [Microbacterium album]
MSALALAGCSANAGGGADASGGEGPAPVTIRAIWPVSVQMPDTTGFFEAFIPTLEEHADWITLDVVGGAEVVPGNDQIEAISNGAFDMALVFPAYLEGLIPGGASILMTSNLLPSEEREAGTAELLNEIVFNPHGVTYLGEMQSNNWHSLYLGKDQCDAIDPADPSLSGLLIRGGEQYRPAVEALGGEIVNMPVAEVYTALERGVIDGYGMGQANLAPQGLEPITGCELQPFVVPATAPLVVNTAWWEGLEEETRTAISEAVVLSEPRIDEAFERVIAEYRESMLEAGVEVIEFSPEFAESYRAEVMDRAWSRAISLNPEFQRLRDHWWGDN